MIFRVFSSWFTCSLYFLYSALTATVFGTNLCENLPFSQAFLIFDVIDEALFQFDYFKFMSNVYFSREISRIIIALSFAVAFHTVFKKAHIKFMALLCGIAIGSRYNDVHRFRNPETTIRHGIFEVFIEFPIIFFILSSIYKEVLLRASFLGIAVISAANVVMLFCRFILPGLSVEKSSKVYYISFISFSVILLVTKMVLLTKKISIDMRRYMAAIRR